MGYQAYPSGYDGDDAARASSDQWAHYLQRFHRERAGITEAALEHAQDPVVGTAYDWLVEALPGRPGCVLDIACGNAPLQPRLGATGSYLGLDLSAAELALALRRRRGPVAQADARRLPMPDRAVDTVVSSMGLMLVTPVTGALREIARVLKPGGMLAVLLPATWPIVLRDVRPLLTLAVPLRGVGAMPQHLSPRRAVQQLTQEGITPLDVQRRRFPFPLRSPADASLAVRALYTPGVERHRLDAAVAALSRLGGAAELPLPLLRIVARRGS